MQSVLGQEILHFFSVFVLFVQTQWKNVQMPATENDWHKRTPWFFLFNTKQDYPRPVPIKIHVCKQTQKKQEAKRWAWKRFCGQFALFGAMPSKEKRGGARIKEIYLQKCQAVQKFIENLTCMESHYCRSIKKLMDMYNALNPNLTIRRTFFLEIFNSEYNYLGFEAPSTDACSKCIKFSEMIKNANDPDVRAAKIIEWRIHKLYDLTVSKSAKNSKTTILCHCKWLLTWKLEEPSFIFQHTIFWKIIAITPCTYWKVHSEYNIKNQQTTWKLEEPFDLSFNIKYLAGSTSVWQDLLSFYSFLEPSTPRQGSLNVRHTLPTCLPITYMHWQGMWVS